MTYFGTQLSENISRREPEGYLICLNVPVARTGVQEYLPSELGMNEPDTRLIPVHRPEEEVFSEACMASFEGMPVTNDHPSAPEGVTAENIQRLQCGHAHNIRRGAGESSDLLLADLIITHPGLIDEVLAGKREISCGYTYTLCEEDGTFTQREIRGNHIAVVDTGRAGPRVSIQDQEPAACTSPQSPVPDSGRERQSPPLASPFGSQPQFTHDSNNERSTPMKKNSLWSAKLMARMARDGDVDGLAEIITEMMEEPAAAAAPAAVAPATPAAVITPAAPAASAPIVSAAAPITPSEEAPIVVETPVDQPVLIDCGTQILEALQRIIALLSGTGTTDDCDPAQDDEPDAAAEAIAETATEELVENVAEAAIEAVAETLDPDLSLDDDPEDPIDALVAEILESDDPDAEAADEDENEIFSHILEPEDADDEDSDDPDCANAADALRATLATFRPMLKRMTPKQRQRFNSDVAARMKKLTASQSKASKPNAYAALRKSATHDASARSLGQQIMATRNANLKKA